MLRGWLLNSYVAIPLTWLGNSHSGKLGDVRLDYISQITTMTAYDPKRTLNKLINYSPRKI